jgi:hypothetical protein
MLIGDTVCFRSFLHRSKKISTRFLSSSTIRFDKRYFTDDSNRGNSTDHRPELEIRSHSHILHSLCGISTEKLLDSAPAKRGEVWLMKR